MATIRASRSGQGGYIVCFRYGDKQYNRHLGTDDRREAEARKKRIEATIHDLQHGRLVLPPDCSDIGTFIVSDGKATAKVQPPRHATLSELWEGYRATATTADSTRITEATHFRHLVRILGPQAALPTLKTADLQRYIRQRSTEAGIRGAKVKAQTITKEVATFRAVWNGYGLPHGLVKVTFQTHFVGRLKFDKDDTKGRFLTLDQIRRQLDRGNLTPAQEAALWDCLFLDRDQLDDLLQTTRQAPTAPPWLYPMALAAAHTGARRSELLRSRPEDIDIDGGTIHLREKKRDHTKKHTYRPVRMSSRLAVVMTEWLKARPQGDYTFTTDAGEGITKKAAHHHLKAALAGSTWANIRGWHLFRHSLASITAMKGTDQRIIDATLGHTTEAMRQRYRHLFPSQQKAALDSIFG